MNYFIVIPIQLHPSNTGPVIDSIGPHSFISHFIYVPAAHYILASIITTLFHHHGVVTHGSFIIYSHWHSDHLFPISIIRRPHSKPPEAYAADHLLLRRLIFYWIIDAWMHQENLGMVAHIGRLATSRIGIWLGRNTGILEYLDMLGKHKGEARVWRPKL
jgi:hypothetical protein